MNIYWLIIAIVFIIIEILTPGIFFFFCLGIGAVAAFTVSFFSGSIFLQSFVFIVVSILVSFLLRPLVMRLFLNKTVKSNIDQIIGQRGIVIEPIDGYKLAGLVKIKNDLWRAVCENDEKIDKDFEIEVIKVDGTHLVVKKI